MNLKRLLLMTILLCGLMISPMTTVSLRADHALEDHIKVAYLLNFARFVTWPDRAFKESTAPIVICILGRDPIDGALHTITGKRVGNRPLIIRRLLTLDELVPCHLLYVGENGAPPVHQILATLKNQPILTISSLPRFSQEGGMITFTLIAHHIRFEINLATAQDAGLFISSRLLKLARLVP